MSSNHPLDLIDKELEDILLTLVDTATSRDNFLALALDNTGFKTRRELQENPAVDYICKNYF